MQGKKSEACLVGLHKALGLSTPSPPSRLL